MRRGPVIAIVTAATLGGSLSAHLVGEFAHAEAGDAHRAAFHTVGPLPTLLAGMVVVAAVVAFRRIRSRRSLLLVTSLAPLAGFVLQELLERLTSIESSPFGPGREPGLVGAIGALLPWAVGAYLLVRALAAVVRAAASSLAPSTRIIPLVATLGVVPPERLIPAGRHDPVLDRPPRAPPRP